MSERPSAIVEARGRNWIQHRDGGRRIIDTSLGSLHYDNGGVLAEVDTDFQDSDDGNYDDRVDRTSYRLYQRDGDRRLYPRRNVLTEWIAFGRPEFQRPNGQWAVIPFDSRTRAGNVISFHRADGRIDIVCGPDRAKINLIIDAPPQRSVWRFPVSLVGLSRTGRDIISDTDGAVVARVAPFTLEDATGEHREIPSTLTGHPVHQGAFEIAPDLAGLTYPVVIDPTVDVSVGASGDDGYYTSFSLNTSGVEAFVGNFFGTSYHSFFRFASVSVPSGVTISTAHITLTASDPKSGATCNLVVSADDADDPAAPTSAADINGRTHTSATVSWSSVPSFTAGNTYDTPEIKTVVQELIDRGGWSSGNAMLFLIDNDGSSTDANRDIATYDHATYAPAELHIEYSTGGAIPIIMHHLKQMGIS